MQRHRPQDTQNYLTSHSRDTQQLVGEFTGESQGDLARIMVKNRFSRYDYVEIMTPNGNERWHCHWSTPCCFATSSVVWLLLKVTLGIRVGKAEEYHGSDITDCGVDAYPEFVPNKQS